MQKARGTALLVDIWSEAGHKIQTLRELVT